jgi:hypothetical protein
MLVDVQPMHGFPMRVIQPERASDQAPRHEIDHCGTLSDVSLHLFEESVSSLGRHFEDLQSGNMHR